MKYPEPKKLYPTKKRNFYLKHFNRRYDESRFSKLMDIIFERLYYLEQVADRKKEEAGEWMNKPKIEEVSHAELPT